MSNFPFYGRGAAEAIFSGFSNGIYTTPAAYTTFFTRRPHRRRPRRRPCRRRSPRRRRPRRPALSPLGPPTVTTVTNTMPEFLELIRPRSGRREF